MSQLISANELNETLASKDTVVLDCRTDLANQNTGFELYNLGHIPGAHFVHLENDLSGEISPGLTGRHPLPTPSQFESSIRNWGIEVDSQIVVYDQSNSMYAARAWWMLKWLGINNVRVLNGGYQTWVAQHLPIQQEAPAPSQSEFVARTETGWTVTANELLDIHPEVKLLDARALERYRGDVEPLDSKAGHIPTAINADFSRNLKSNGEFLPKEALNDRFSSLQNHEVICYCGSGVTACHNILAIVEAGLPMPKLYPGSWSEWIVDESRPIALGVEGELT
jgi:thiosulfate/3-mercaptopyruvate sulfurtransferase